MRGADSTLFEARFAKKVRISATQGGFLRTEYMSWLCVGTSTKRRHESRKAACFKTYSLKFHKT
jgi:hypothetical protein